MIRLTPLNVFQYIGRQIIFKSRKNYKVNRIISASTTGESIRIDDPDLQNALEIVSRIVYVIIE